MPVKNQSIYDTNGGIKIISPKTEKNVKKNKEKEKNGSKKDVKK